MQRLLIFLAGVVLSLSVHSQVNYYVFANPNGVTFGGIPNPAPGPAQAAGFNTKTFDSTALSNTLGTLYFPTGFFNYNGGTAQNNSDGSFTLTNGANDPSVATAHADNTKTNKWGGTCFQNGAYFESTSSSTPFNSYGKTSWPGFGIYDSTIVVNNTILASAGNQWTQTIVGTAPANNATSMTIPAWQGTITVSAQVTFSDSEVKTVSFVPSATSISWTGGLTGSTFTGTINVLFGTGTTYGHWPEIDVMEQNAGGYYGGSLPQSLTSVSIDGTYDWYAVYGSNTKVHTNFTPIANINTALSHKYAVLWVPWNATQGYGSLTWYYDDTQVNQQTWSTAYNVNTPPAPTGSNTNSHLFTGGTAMSVVDSRCMVPFWQTAAGTGTNAVPITVTSFRVWQSSNANAVTQ